MHDGHSTNFDVTIHTAPPGTTGSTYPFSIAYRARTAEGIFSQDIHDPFWQQTLPQLDDPTRAPGRALLVKSGSRLFRGVMQGAARDLWIRARADLEERVVDTVRIRLAIHPPTVARLPWELLYDGERNEAFAASSRTPLVRVETLFQHVGASRAAQIVPPIPILIVVPEDPAGHIDPAQEIRQMESTFARLGPTVVKISTLTGRFDIVELRQQIDRVRPAILHFIGHGTPDGLLLWRDEQPIFAPPGSVRTILQDATGIKLVFLNACLAGQLSGTQPFSTMAPQLLQAGTPAVIAMQFAISDRYATQFAAYLYEELLTGRRAGVIDAAVGHARGNLYALDPDRVEYSAPILWLNAEDGAIFDLPSQRASPAEPPAAALHADHLRGQVADIERWLQSLAQWDESSVSGEIRTWLVHRNRELRQMTGLLAQLHALDRHLDAVSAEAAPVQQYEAKLAEIRRKQESVRRLDARIQQHGDKR